MSKQILTEIATLRKRGVPDTDPRIKGLLRRQEVDKAAEKEPNDVSHTLKKALKEFVK